MQAGTGPDEACHSFIRKKKSSEQKRRHNSLKNQIDNIVNRANQMIRDTLLWSEETM